MSTLDFSGLNWRKSSRSTSTGDNGNCVEIAFAETLVAVRDSKNPHAAPLAIPATAFASLLRAFED